MLTKALMGKVTEIHMYTHMHTYSVPIQDSTHVVTMIFFTVLHPSDPNNISKSSFNNAFYSSALRDWQEHIALGSFTPEYKAKIRGEEKRRTTVKPEDLWKKKFYEDTWGDK